MGTYDNHSVMVVSIRLVDSLDHIADWELWVPALPRITREYYIK